eukprot:COSAG05_NODE_14287_length_401_cov_2.158940_1_plen_37_part_10
MSHYVCYMLVGYSPNSTQQCTHVPVTTKARDPWIRTY